jgi:ubiquitin conjugation factor E4 B
MTYVAKEHSLTFSCLTVPSRDDLEYLPVLVSLPPITIFEYLVGSWKRLNSARSALIKKVSCLLTAYAQILNATVQKFPPPETQLALGKLEKLRELMISYAGLTIQEPDMFPQPEG